MLGRRSFALESAAARESRRRRQSVLHVIVRDLDLRAPDVHDGRRLKIAEGLPLFGRAQLALDTTLASALHCDGSARPHAADVVGVALSPRRRRKELTYPELVGPRSRARLVVLAGEVGGRWSAETMSFLGLLAKARARSETHLKRRRVEQAWRIRWSCMCAAARAVAASLLEQRVSIGGDGNAPVSHEVVADHRYAGLGWLSRPLCRLPTVLADSFSSLCALKKKHQETTRNNGKQLETKGNKGNNEQIGKKKGGQKRDKKRRKKGRKKEGIRRGKVEENGRENEKEKRRK